MKDNFFLIPIEKIKWEGMDEDFDIGGDINFASDF